eukprot:510498-Amphidinium_carterae.1
MILSEGILRARGADDTHYDGKLAFATAPKVVFFQVSQDGCDSSLYPRTWQGWKTRFCVPPSHLALQADCFKMYFVSITAPRLKPEHRDRKPSLLQMHLLFIRSNHPQIQYCDEHFLLLNKFNFQPFQCNQAQNDPQHTWYGYQDRTRLAFQGRGCKINVAVAEDVPIWYGRQERSMLDRLGYGAFDMPPRGVQGAESMQEHTH